MRHDDDPHEDGGLFQDLARLRTGGLPRRDLLRLALGASLLPLLGCGAEASAGDGACARIPTETAGPFPGDGTNGPNVLAESGVVRSDLRASVGSMSGTAAGVLLTVTLTLVDSRNGCAPLAGHALYLWHCDREGRYSLYESGVTEQNYLRGVQESDANGQLTFTTVFPGCYAGRWPHMHFEVFRSLATATAAGAKLATSQLALPEAACSAAYATAGYERSAGNLRELSLASDGIFRDGSASQLAQVTGSVAEGYAASLTIAL